MITNFLINVLYDVAFLFTLPARLFENVTLPATMTSAISSAAPALGTINAVVPVTTVLAIVALFVVVEFAILTWKGVNWIIRKIPGVN